MNGTARRGTVRNKVAMISTLDIFRIGIGPSSSHTLGPVYILDHFLSALSDAGRLEEVARLHVELQGSLALTGLGHGTPDAVLIGALGLDPETLDIDAAQRRVASVRSEHVLPLLGRHPIPFDPARDMHLACEILPEPHPNGIRVRAWDGSGAMLRDETWYSIGGGAIAREDELLRRREQGPTVTSGGHASGADLLAHCTRHGITIAEAMLEQEDTLRPRAETLARVDRIAQVMNACIERGLHMRGTLPGGLKVRRRAPELYAKLAAQPIDDQREAIFDWLNVYAMAVSEENAAGGRVVTAPTNGAAGILPSVLRHYCLERADPVENARTLLLTAAAIGALYKQRASISGAEMGCQGEVGVACSMAAAGLAAIWGASPERVLIAAEIGMEHNLGLTCDPVDGLVQIPCIERNAIGTVKAANAARLALHTEGPTKVSLDQVIETMRQTGIDMSSKYKETSLGGLAVNVIEC